MDIIPILSPKYSASSNECVVNIIILLFLNSLRKSHKALFDMISIPLVGSSNRTNSELPIIAKATHNFLFSPPDNVLHIASFFCTRPIFVVKAFICSKSLFIPFISIIYFKCSYTVKYSKNILSC